MTMLDIAEDPRQLRNGVAFSKLVGAIERGYIYGYFYFIFILGLIVPVDDAANRHEWYAHIGVGVKANKARARKSYTGRKIRELRGRTFEALEKAFFEWGMLVVEYIRCAVLREVRMIPRTGVVFIGVT